jgi:hypothetical protein
MKKSLLMALLFVSPAFAHHSFAAFDKTKTATLVGTVKYFEFTNPHVWIWINVPNDGLYGLESGGPSQYDRMGLGRDTFKPGMPLTITYHPLRDGRKGGQFLTAKMPDGSTLDMMKQVKTFASGEVAQP